MLLLHLIQQALQQLHLIVYRVAPHCLHLIQQAMQQLHLIVYRAMQHLHLIQHRNV